MTSKLLSPEEIAVRAGEQVPFLRLPPATVFSERAARLAALAADDHPMAGFLNFIATLARAQHQSLQAGAGATSADAAHLDAHAGEITPPYDAVHWRRQAGWHDATRALLASVGLDGLPPATVDAVQRVSTASDEFLDAQADRILNHITLGLDFAAAPLIAAGLQAHWTSLVRKTEAEHGERAFGRTVRGNLCPCCASAPVGGITRLGAEESGYRYLQCSLCSTQWHYVRIKCTTCENTKGLHYEALSTEGEAERTARTRDVVRAECCPECHRYLKIFSMEKDPNVEPMADDLATIALDLLVADTGLVQGGVDLMLYYGDPGDH
ncbi:formate dehydrogenase accessory protein FdhE [soil metagenome]